MAPLTALGTGTSKLDREGRRPAIECCWTLVTAPLGAEDVEEVEVASPHSPSMAAMAGALNEPRTLVVRRLPGVLSDDC